MRYSNPKVTGLTVSFLSAMFFLLLSGCGSNQPTNSTQVSAPTALSYSTSIGVYTQGLAITANTPTTTGGRVSSYSVTPPLPPGILLDSSTGVISGTPLKPKATTIHTVTAENSAGSTTGPVTITVNVAAPLTLSYSSPTAYYTAGVPIPLNFPIVTGGAPATYSINPNLTPGLSLRASAPAQGPAGPTMSAGVISGIPASAEPETTYTVTATNAAGSVTATVTITVLSSNSNAAPLGLSYTSPAPVYVAGVAITPNAPVLKNSGQSPVTYSVSPTLPAGLTMNSAGVVSGTPAAIASTIVPPPPVTSSYLVTATNSAGNTTAPLTITIYNSPQSVPNLAQQITPLATANASFQFLDTGMVVTDPIDTRVPPVEWMAGHAASSVVSPDGNTLLVLTSGFNRVFQDAFPFFDPLYSSEYVFIFDIHAGAPAFEQVVPLPNTYHGIVWDTGKDNQGNYHQAFYVSGGMGDAAFGTDPIPYFFPDLTSGALNNGDNIHIIQQNPATGYWSQTAELGLGQPANNLTPTETDLGIALGHPSGNGLPVPNSGFASVNAAVYVAPCAAGLAISSDGQTLVVANYYNDSITVFTGGLDGWVQQYHAWPTDTGTLQGYGTLQGTELDLRPGTGLPGGEYPFWVAVTGNGTQDNPYTAYISSLRDREIDVVTPLTTCTVRSLSCPVPMAVKTRIAVKGQPNKMTVNLAGTLLYVAEDESDTVDVISLATNRVVESIPVIAPPSVMQSLALSQYTGANTNSVTLSPDEKYLYLTNGNLNNVGVVQLGGTNTSDHVVGLIPTGWYPNAVSLSKDGSWAYVINAKSPTGPNPNFCYTYGPPGYPSCMASNEYNPQLTKAGLLSFPLAGAMSSLPSLTTQVTKNNRFAAPSGISGVMAAVHDGIQHVIYILKENRTYDQILGDLPRGNGDPTLALFGQVITPNQHKLAEQFVTLDNFRASAETSNDGWPWSTSARAPDVIEHQFPVNYAQRGLSLDSEGLNRSVNVALPTVSQRQASNPLYPGGALSPEVPNGENLLPGQTDVAAPDGPDDEVNTGYLWDNALRAGLTVRDYGWFVDTTCYNVAACQIPLAHDPFATNTIVAPSSNVALAPYTDPYFRGFDPSFPDYYRFKEWERDFDTNYAKGGLPNLTLVRFMHDHTGNFATAIDLVNTPDRDQADNDYAVGLLIEKIANSPVYKNNTLIFVVEDDSQDGGDHIDSHRTTAYVAGTYVRDAVVSTAYTTVDFVRTIEEVLGLPPMNLNDALATPMSDIFNTVPNRKWSFTAAPASILYCTSLPLPEPRQPCNNPAPDARYWAQVTKGMNFNEADQLDGAVFNRILWKGLMGDKPYPAAPTGLDLRPNREKLLADYRRSLQRGAAQTTKTVKN
jgi:YVTN family beta-propeller protein